jgi:ribonucleoside-diphosphate reductase alpha chain
MDRDVYMMSKKIKLNKETKKVTENDCDKIAQNSYLTPEAENICKKRYYQKDENGIPIETWPDLVKRVVDHVCKNENEKYKTRIYELILHTKFLPNSPCLVNAGSKSRSAGLLACFVTPSPADCWCGKEELEPAIGMTENIENFGHIARRGGGAGVNFSNIRPEGDSVFGSTHAKACGPIEHMRMISEVMYSITQSGFRGMAMLGALNISHPDIFNFIKCKQKERALKTALKEDFSHHYDSFSENTDSQLQVILDKFIYNFNISVVATDDFMRRVENDEDFNLEFSGKIYKTIKAKDLFNAIAENAWRNGDPGFLFYDRMNEGPYKYSKQTICATNPCGEQMLPSWGSCNLGSINVSKFYDEDKNSINWAELKEAVALSTRFLDCVIDVNRFPTKSFEKWAKENRPVGLGIMGWADLLLKMKLSYGKKRSLELAEELTEFIYKEANRISVILAKENGTPKACEYKELEYRRNVTLLSIAPTGTISMIANCSSSIEPIFCPTVYRTDNTGSRQIACADSDKPYFRCAVDPEKKEGREVTYEEHILMQSSFQKYVDSAISKTINMPNSASLDDVKNAYMLAWKKGAKGVTIYRDMSKSTQVLNTSDKTIMQVNNAQKRPKKIEADIFGTKALGKDWHIIIGKVNNKPYELFAVNGSVELPEKGYVVKNKSRHYSLVNDKEEVIIDNIIKTEKDIDINIDKETRRFSLELRHGIPPKYIVEQIDKSNDYMYSLSKAISRIFATKYITVDEFIKKPCPACAERGVKTQMILSAGCWKCSDESCGYSKCG